jgi:DNA-directed RNA polymerase alpha subunit
MTYLHNQKVLAFLRAKLSEADFAAFLEITATQDHLPLKTHLTKLQFSVRTEKCLQNERILTIYDVVTRTEADFLRIPRFGRKSLNELKEVLAESGWRIGEIPKALEAA